MLDATPLISPNIERLFVIDFETFYSPEYGLKKLTTSAYVRDPRFQVIGVGVMELSPGGSLGLLSKVWHTEKSFVAWAKSVAWSRAAVIAHHAHFDGLILAEHFGITPGFWFDTLSMANVLGLSVNVGGSLAKLMEYFGVGQKGHAVHDFIGKRLEDFTPEELAAYGEYCVNDCEGEAAIWRKMEPHVSPIEAAGIDLTVRCFTEARLFMDRPLLESALVEEQKRKEDLISRIEGDKETLLSNDKFAVLLTNLGVEPPTKTSPATGKETWAFAKSDPGLKELLESPIDEVRWLVEARVGVKSTIAESRIGRMLKLTEGDKKAPIYLKYSAAHTQRWGGGDKTNFQNLPRKGPLRDALIAPAGHTIIACDSAQIEARGLAWLAGQADLVEAFRQKRDVYSEFASVAYGRKIDRKKNKEDEIPGFVGKTATLGLGYGMGPWKMALTFLAGAMGGPPVQFTKAEADAMGVDVERFAAKNSDRLASFVSRLTPEAAAIHVAVCDSLVKTYRKTNAKIPEFWQEGDELIFDMADGAVRVFGPGQVFKTARHAIVRPSGLRLQYKGLDQREEDDGSFTYLGGPIGKKITKIYGGLLTENIVQSFCRDIIVEQAAALHWGYGVPIVTLTHDEIVTCVPDHDADRIKATMLDVMAKTPAWCQGLPLAAEAKAAKSYGACK